jgi:hypothetical protein
MIRTRRRDLQQSQYRASPNIGEALQRKSRVNPLEHYHQYGWREGRDPSKNFDTQLYLQNNPDVNAAGIDPLEHYLAIGRFEGRSAFEDGLFG